MLEHYAMYDEIAGWFTTLTSPEDYEEEAVYYHEVLTSSTSEKIETVLELGAGAGNNALHMKRHYSMTLTDISPKMLAVSQQQNPDLEHHLGDMRTLRLNREFNAVFIHDAICYMTTLEDLRAALETAAIHVKRGGIVLVVPDLIRETFKEYTEHGGGDYPRSMRYLEWVSQLDPDSHIYHVDFAYMLREENGEVRVISERQTFGVFSRDEWFEAFKAVGLNVDMLTSPVEGVAQTHQPVFVAQKP